MDKTMVQVNSSLEATITGVRLVERQKIWDERGAVFHMLRKDDPEFQAFGEIYFSVTRAGVVKAWKLHKRIGLNLFLVSGQIRLALVDGRPASTTYGKSLIIELNESQSRLVVIPAGVWSGFQGLGERDSILANCATEPHDPGETERRDVNHKEMPTPWEL